MQGAEEVSTGLLTYPVLMAADILLYQVIYLAIHPCSTTNLLTFPKTVIFLILVLLKSKVGLFEEDDPYPGFPLTRILLFLCFSAAALHSLPVEASICNQ